MATAETEFSHSPTPLANPILTPITEKTASSYRTSKISPTPPFLSENHRENRRESSASKEKLSENRNFSGNDSFSGKGSASSTRSRGVSLLFRRKVFSFDGESEDEER